MYHLTCPSCQDVTESPFVRSGAVVRCPACESKYRIKSAYFQREVHTGPRTLDETDSVLRSDSVDIDPDEMPPVSIDDDGNVVGLSGLSELMRWSDNQAANQSTDVSSAVHERASHDHTDALPAAKSTSKKKKQPAVGLGRARAQALKRKKRNKMVITLSSTAIVLVVLVFVIVQLLGNELTKIATDDIKPAKPAPNTPAKINPTDPSQPDTTQDPTPPNEVDLFNDPNQPEPNPDIRFVAPWLNENSDTPPADIPTVLTTATTLNHEGWYVMNPPRGSADASGVTTVQLGPVTPSLLNDSLTLLATSLTNSSDQTMMQGELHIMLLDSTGNVFAETYTPLAMIGPRSKQPYALTIPTRYWKRSRGLRAAVTVQDWADQTQPLQDVRLHPTNLGPSSVLRISAKHIGDKTLRNVTILINATDNDGNAIANFLLKEENLYIRPNHWLDLIVQTPLPPSKQTANWSATIIPQ